MDAKIQKPLEAIARHLDPRNDFNRQCIVSSDNISINVAVTVGKGALNAAKPIYRLGALGAIGGTVYGLGSGDLSMDYVRVGWGVGVIADYSQIIFRLVNILGHSAYNRYFGK